MQELGLHSVRVDAKKLHKRKQQLKKENLKCVVGAGEGHIPEEAALDIIFAEFRRMASL